MTARRAYSGPTGSRLTRFARDETGATMVEFAMVLALLLLIIFGLIDFGRLAFHIVTAERSMQIAARVAAVRPPACAGVPSIHRRSASASSTPEFGTNCNAGSDICADVGTITCNGDSGNDTAWEIWRLVQGSLPVDADISALRFSYAFDPDLGFLGGPYVPMVTVELDNVTFEFISPLSALAALAGATATSTEIDADITLPSMSVSLPGEDLAMGETG